ncbi:SNF2-related protein [Pontiella sulfatireligans]|uniref:RNA polymerase-associated protein RapA n=1 Tax=Pontiella sulfatireligans TaxID=2750658 RepID=A0A6C2UG90_9BACT|nr:SNF2-related protein [Pontiella sulfatireligans]VGO18537.1 RNA polymerase-associated protein RapA [Pontiella sulfatireligans]
MPLTNHQAKYLAHELTRRWSSDSVGKLAAAVAGAQVDLNPHQVDAALFAFKSPFSNGALLADEVGLGKTIEAGILLSQRWAERKRSILIITPSNLRKQWHQELAEKFFLPATILEARSYKQAIKAGSANPFQPDEPNLVICSYHFARNKAEDVVATPWDLVVIDEAHRLRNVYKTSNVIANTLKKALEGRPKVLLTATPLQNSLLELYGLVSFIDEHAFGDLKSFRQQFANLSLEGTFDALKARIAPLCHRTLRRQVTQYVPYTARHAIVEEFSPEESEELLYQLVSEYLARDNLFALPPAQRTLMTLVLRKLLASSTFAIAGALQTMARRLGRDLAEQESLSLVDELDEEYEALGETADEWTEDDVVEPLSENDRAALAEEIAELEAFAELAVSITNNAKGQALLRALKIAFNKVSGLKAAEKAIIFTESRRTQDYLFRLLSESEWSEGIVLFNGSNTDLRSKEIYEAWKVRNEGSDHVTGSRTADMRSALVDYFRDEGRIMIATEAGAEGINLQFCSLVINYDLPWNPQRVEQRIGRCHRYGQKHDVVVVNFLNKKNAADQRVYQLLAEKFHLFEGVFGASDEVLGAIGSGVDFEKRIATIYHQCRQPEEIKEAFDTLQLELSFEINEAMTSTRKKLLEHFDDEVREKLKIRDEDSKAILGQFERQLIRLSRHELSGHAEFQGEGSFRLLTAPFSEIAEKTPIGLYELPRRTGEAHLYRIGHPLADAVIRTASGLVDFDDIDYEKHADLLYELASQTVNHFRAYLSEEETKKILWRHQKEIAAFIHAQMQEHYWEDEEVEYEVVISKGFTELKSSAYTASATEDSLDFKVSPKDKSNMSKYLFGGFQKCLYPVQKFDAEGERILAVILDREADKWFKPAKGQFQIFYKLGADHPEYQPDFVAETADAIYMLEPKARNKMDDPEVLAKKDAAEKWCRNATDYAAKHGGKPWHYRLIPHDTISENMSIDHLGKV